MQHPKIEEDLLLLCVGRRQGHHNNNTRDKKSSVLPIFEATEIPQTEESFISYYYCSGEREFHTTVFWLLKCHGHGHDDRDLISSSPGIRHAASLSSIGSIDDAFLTQQTDNNMTREECVMSRGGFYVRKNMYLIDGSIIEGGIPPRVKSS